MEDILLWPVTSVWGGVAGMSDACGLPCEYGDALKTPAALMHLFVELFIAHYDKEGKLAYVWGMGLASTVGNSTKH